MKGGQSTSGLPLQVPVLQHVGWTGLQLALLVIRYALSWEAHGALGNVQVGPLPACALH